MKGGTPRKFDKSFFYMKTRFERVDLTCGPYYFLPTTFYSHSEAILTLTLLTFALPVISIY